jgi:Na+-transporting NADH:ubiquinone oxidoreductase subunit F
LLALWFSFGHELRADGFPFRGTVVEIKQLTHDTKWIRFRLVDATGFHFTPGQYTFLKVPDDFVKQWNERYRTTHEEVARAYSFASTSSRLPFFDLIIKLVSAPPGMDVPPGLATTYIHTRLKTGDEVRFGPPVGDLYLRKDTGRPILIIAGGTGAAPFISLLEYWFENGFEKNNEIYFFFGARSRRDLFLHDQFQNWAKEKKTFHYIPALSHPTQEVVEKHVPAASDADAYLAGPPIMLREAVKVLNSKGIPEDRIHYDQIIIE